MRFGNHVMLAVACAVPVAIAILYEYDRRRRALLVHRIGELPVLGKVMASASPRRRLLKALLQMAGATLLALALARPQRAGERSVAMQGLDVVIAVDVSKSMLVDDVGSTQAMVDKKIKPTRLARARELASALIDALPDEKLGSRVGPVVFAGAAAHFPLTEDREVAARFFYDLGAADLPPGSNLAEMFRASRCLLRPDLYDDLGCAKFGRRGHGGDPLPGDREVAHPRPDELPEVQGERGKAIVVLTDGGDPDAGAMREVATARELGIAVFVVGFGTPQGGVVHEIDANGNPTDQVKHTRDGQTVVSKRDDQGMKALAAAGGDEGRFLVAAERGEVDPTPIVEGLRNVERGLAQAKIKDVHDVFPPFVFAGLLLLVIDAAISTRRRRRYPEEA
ncbi:MAG: BatA domain-containing protein [Acidobacteriota bacterium]